MALHEVDIWDRSLARVGDQRIIESLAATVVTTGSDATAANPVVVTTGVHGYSTGDLILIRGFTQMTEVNGRVFKITVVNTTTFSLDDEDGLLYTAETSGGDTFKLADNKNSKECFDAWTDVRDEVLAEHSWNNCVKRDRLARKEASVAVTTVSNANPALVTGGAHTYATGDQIFLDGMIGKMDQLDGRWFTITVPSGSTTTFELNGEDSTDYGSYTGGSGDTAEKALIPFKPDSGYLRRYDLPSDSLRILGLSNSTSLWVVEGDEVLTDDGITVPITYVFRQKDVTKFSPILVSLLAARLEAEICEVLTHGNKKRELALQSWRIQLEQAKRADAREQSPMPLGEDKWVSARWNRFNALSR